jgi:streptomycin 6-kinase
MNIPEELREGTYTRIGIEAGNQWFVSSQRQVDYLCNRWMLSPISILPGGSISLCVLCLDLSGTKVVLKIPKSREYGLRESSALKIWTGQQVPNVLGVDEPTGAFLLEYVPGQPVDEPQAIASVFSVIQGIHGLGEGFSPFHELGPNLTKWFNGTRKRFAPPEYQHYLPDLNRAAEILDSLIAHDSRRILLHGDFQLRNLMLTKDRLIAFDPSPCLGSPLFDYGTFIAQSHHLYPYGGGFEALASHLPNEKDLLLRWTWAISVLGNRPNQLKGTHEVEREWFIDRYREAMN